jgi:hypothetical protein
MAVAILSLIAPWTSAHEKTSERFETIFASHAHVCLRVEVEPVLVAAVTVDVVQDAGPVLAEGPGDAAEHLVAGLSTFVQSASNDVGLFGCQ